MLETVTESGEAPDGDFEAEEDDDVVLRSNKSTSSGKKKKAWAVSNKMDMRVIFPRTAIFYVPPYNSDLEKVHLGLKVLGVGSCKWTLHYMANAGDQLTVIPFKPKSSTIAGEGKSIKHSPRQGLHRSPTLATKRRRRSVRRPGADIPSPVDFLPTKKASRRTRLYAFLIVNKDGSRILSVCESRRVAEKLRSGAKPSQVMDKKREKRKTKIKKNLKTMSAASAKSGSPTAGIVPWIVLTFSFSLPRLTVTWIHQSDVVLALHVTNVSINGVIVPKRLPSLEHIRAQRTLQAAEEAMRRLGHGAGRGIGPKWASYLSPLLEAGGASGMERTGDAAGLDLLSEFDYDYRKELYTNSVLQLLLLVEQIHVDHFVKGDIPVVLKNNPPKDSRQDDVFLWVSIVRSLVDYSQAPVYEDIDVRISPISANIELLVIEQLIQVAEKEHLMLKAYTLGEGGAVGAAGDRSALLGLLNGLLNPATGVNISSGDCIAKAAIPGDLHLALASPTSNGTDGDIELFRRHFHSVPRVFAAHSNSAHHLIFPNPRWVELKVARPIYLKNLRISPILVTISIRTSEHRISRQVLHIVDALPLDTPYMSLQIGSEKKRFTVCSWDELFHSLRNSYLRQLIRKSLPALFTNPLAFVTGVVRGAIALVRHTTKGAITYRNKVEGVLTGFRIGVILFIIYSMGGIFQSASHFLNVAHKLLGGSRPRPYGVLDAIWKGFNGLLLDVLWKPWVALLVEPYNSVDRGDRCFTTTWLTVGCALRCIFCPIFGILNAATSIAEGFANTLIGDFEQFTRVQERADLNKQRRSKGPRRPSDGEHPRRGSAEREVS